MSPCICTINNLNIHSILLPNGAALWSRSHDPLFLHRKTCTEVSKFVHTKLARVTATRPANHRTSFQATAWSLWVRNSTPRPLTAITAIPYTIVPYCSTGPFSRHKRYITDRCSILSEPQTWTATVDIVAALSPHRLLFRVIGPKGTRHCIERLTYHRHWRGF